MPTQTVSASTARGALIGLDWGTSTLRAFLFDANGRLLAQRQGPWGIMNLPAPQQPSDPAGRDPEPGPAQAEPPDAAFERALQLVCGDWLQARPAPALLACGMVGSAQGWRAARYLDAPASLDALARALTLVPRADGAALLHIVPGLIARGALPDVLRGEETQVLGVLTSGAGAAAQAGMAAGGAAPLLIGLPGTHGKWVLARGRRIERFVTFMTGELFATLCAHSILGRTMQAPAAPDDGAFLRGLRVVQQAGANDPGLLAQIFSTRTLGLTDALPAAAQADYLSGLLVGSEIAGLLRTQAPGPLAPVVLCGAPDLCRRYALALDAFGLGAAEIAPQATQQGLWQIACAAGLVAGSEQTAGPGRAAQASPAAAALRATTAPCTSAPVSAASRAARTPAAAALARALQHCALIAILRGVQPHEAAALGLALYRAGLRIIEVPLNSPDPLASIRALRAALPADALLGAGTVFAPQDCAQIGAAGGQLIVMPHGDPALIRAAGAAGLVCAPGVATATEACAALAAGADLLKLFPADALGPALLKAWRAVLPPAARLLPVGGITPESIPAWAAAGASGFGLGSALYRPGDCAAALASRAADFVAAWRSAYPGAGSLAPTVPGAGPNGAPNPAGNAAA